MSSLRQTEVIRAQLVSKAILSPDEAELYTLTQLAGIVVDQQVFKIILDLLKLSVPPLKIIQTLKSMCCPHKQSLSDEEARLPDSSSSTSLEPSVQKTTHRQRDSSGRGGVDVTRSDRSGRVQSQERSCNTTQVSTSYGHSGSSYSDFSLGHMDRDGSSSGNSQLHSMHASDTYGRNESWLNNSGRYNQPSALRTDSFITTRRANYGSEN